MLLPFTNIALALFAFEASAASPHQPFSLRRKDDSSTLPTINTTILSANGTDLTDSFKIMIYNQPNKSIASSLSNRQPSFSRPITFCKSPTAAFLTSYCKHSRSRNILVRLQDYTVHCQELRPLTSTVVIPTSQSSTTDAEPFLSTSEPQFVRPYLPPVVSEDGACAPEEICVDGPLFSGVAHCVSTAYFVQMINKGRGQSDVQEAVGELAGKTARMIVSEADGSTPLEVQGIDLKAGVTEEKVNAERTPTQERKCRHCFELRTQKMAQGTDFLKTEASLMTAATVAAGVVWLIVSG